MISRITLQLGKLRHGDVHLESVVKPGTRSQCGVGAQLGAGCNVGTSQHDLSLRIKQSEVMGRVTTAVWGHWGCEYYSWCQWHREALDELHLPIVTL